MGEVIQFPTPRRGEPYMRQREAAAYLGVTPRTLRKWGERGLPCHRVNGTPLYRASELDAWVELTGRLRSSQG